MTTCLGKELFTLFTARVFRKMLSMFVLSYFPFGFEGRIWDLIVSVPDHCLSFYFGISQSDTILYFMLIHEKFLTSTPLCNDCTDYGLLN